MHRSHSPFGAALTLFAIIAKGEPAYNPVGHNQQVLFNHVGKAGGGSVRNILYKSNLLHNTHCCTGNMLVDVFHPYGTLTRDLKHPYIILNVRDPVAR